MRSQQTLDGIVLRTYNVGEADRLCVVFTRERGRIAMRARGVRKVGSRMGPLVLPGRRLQIDVREDGVGIATIVAAALRGEIADWSNARSFAAAQQGIELVLLLTEDEEPLPMVFDLLLPYMHVCAVDPARVHIPFQLRLFHLLGFLPSHHEDRRFAVLSEDEQAFVRLCARCDDFAHLCAEVAVTPRMTIFVNALLTEHAQRDLKSSTVLASLALPLTA